MTIAAACPPEFPPARGVLLVFQQAFRQRLVSRAEQREETHLRLRGNDLENVHAVVVGNVTQQHPELGGLEMVQRILDQREGRLGGDIGREFRADGLEKEVTFLVVEVLVEFREVGVVTVLGGGKQRGAILRVDGAADLRDRIFVVIFRHAAERAGVRDRSTAFRGGGRRPAKP